LDRIFAAFAEYRYWSAKSLKARVQQPENWLRTILDKVADLHRSGPFANHWELKPENRRADSAVKEEQAAEVDNTGDWDEGDEAMEDVPL